MKKQIVRPLPDTFSLKAFGDDIEALKKQAYSGLGKAEYIHMRKIEVFGRLASCIGYATIWLFPNILTAFALSLGQFTRWLLAHHILHRGYDRIPSIPKRYTSKGFAKGYRRYLDWFDWIMPTAWDYEHNYLHHYHTGEEADPDLVERHTEFLRALPIPKSFKYLFIGVAACTWKFSYYAPNTVSVLEPGNGKRIRSEHIVFITIMNIFDLSRAHVRKLWTHCYLPYGIFHFVLIPALFLPFGQTIASYVLMNKLLAELLTNIHSFIVIAPNHTADDLYRFSFHYDDKNEFYLTQILGSANYTTGKEWIDYLSIYLNYQIEHHLFPDLPMLRYRQIQPEVKALCEKHGVPYRQENIFVRLKRMVDICVGNNSMKELAELNDILNVDPTLSAA